MDKYVKVKNIGEGSFGKAILVRNSKNGEQYVIKEISISKMQAKERQEARKEVDVLSKMRHPYIVQYVESFEEKGCLYIVMEYCEGGDLYARINSQRGMAFSETKVLEWFVQICLALKHVHDRKILHRDIKTSNIFLTKTGAIKLGDFGIARVLNNTCELARTCIGTPYYLSPEICERKPYNNKSDVWALGCVLYEVLTLKHAFEAGNMKNLVLKIIRGSYPPVSSRYSYDLRGLVGKLFRRNPCDRPSVNTILRQQFIQKYIEKFLTPEQLEEEFSHTVLHKNRKPPRARPQSAISARARADDRPRPVISPTPANARARQIAGIYGQPAGGPKPKSAAPKYRRLAEQRRRVLAEQNKKQKNEHLEILKKRKQELERKKKEDLARLQLLQADKARQQQLRRDRDRALKLNLKRSSDIFDQKKNSGDGEQQAKKDPPNPKFPRPTSAPSQEHAQKYEKYHQYLARLRERNGYNAGEPAQGKLAQVKEAWNERENAQKAVMEAIGNKVEAQMGADRARAASKYVEKRDDMENRGRIMFHRNNGHAAMKPHDMGVPEPRGRNKEEEDYLKRLQQIRIQNFNERRALQERRRAAQYKSLDESEAEKRRKAKVDALRKQAEEADAIRQKLVNVEPKHDEYPVSGRNRNPHLYVEKKEEAVRFVANPIGITQALNAIGVDKSAPEQSKPQVQELSQAKASEGVAKPVLRKNILKRLNEKFLAGNENTSNNVDPEKSEPPLVARKAWSNDNKSSNESTSDGAVKKDIGLKLAAMPLEQTASQMKDTVASENVKKWSKPSNTVVNQLNLLSLCDPTLTMAPLDENEETLDATESLKSSSSPSPVKTSSPHNKPDVAQSQCPDRMKNMQPTTKDITKRPPIARKGTVVIGDLSAAALHSTPEVDKPQPKPARVAALAANFGSVAVCPKATFNVPRKEEVDSGQKVNQLSEPKIPDYSPQPQNKEMAATKTNSNLSAEQDNDDIGPKKTCILSSSNSKDRAETPSDEVEETIEVPAIDSITGVRKPQKPIQLAWASPKNENKMPTSSDSQSVPAVKIDESKAVSRSAQLPTPERSASVCSRSLPMQYSLKNPLADHFSPAKLSKTLYATASDEMVLKITLGHFDSPNPRLLRTCSLPDLTETPNVQKNEGALGSSSVRRSSDADASQIALDEVSDGRTSQEEISQSANDTNFDEMDLMRVSDEVADDDESVEDDDVASLRANLEHVLEIASSEDEDDDPAWESDDEEEDEDSSEENGSDVSDAESVFSRLEANREELEREMGFDEFMKAYQFIQAMHEDENDEIKDCEERIRAILGKNHDRLYPRILQLVMADGAYCEDNN